MTHRSLHADIRLKPQKAQYIPQIKLHTHNRFTPKLLQTDEEKQKDISLHYL